MLDANNPNPLTHVNLFGHPFHGLCKDGVLHLPNGQTMPYPQPANGDVFMQRVPGAAGASGLTPEQLAGETAAGHTWIDYGLLSGGALQFWGHNIGGWIYIDPEGVRWLVRLVSLPTAPGASMTIRLVRFGEFGGADEAYDHVVPVPSYTTFDGADVEGVRLAAISPDGSTAILGGVAYVYERYNGVVIPVVWLRIDIAGPGPSASVNYSIEADGNETIVVGAHNPTINGFTVYNVGIQTDYAYIPSSTDYPPCFDERNSVVGVTVEEVPGLAANPIRVGAGDARLEIDEWIVGYAWSGGHFEKTSLSVSLVNSYSYPMPGVSASGRVSGGVKKDGDSFIGFSSGIATSSASRACSTNSSFSVSLSVGGEVVDSVSHSMEILDTYNVNTLYEGLGDGGYRQEQHYVHTRAITYDGVTVNSTPLDYHIFNYPHGNGGRIVDLDNMDESDADVIGIGVGAAFCPDAFGSAVNAAARGYPTIVGGFDQPLAACLACWNAADPAGVDNTRRIQTAVQLVSNALSCLVTTEILTGSPPFTLSRTCGGVFGPGGSSAPAPGDLTSPISATWHPVTGDIAVDPAGLPICWV